VPPNNPPYSLLVFVSGHHEQPVLGVAIIWPTATLDRVTVVTSFTCSKMRPDGFGGMAVLITADTIKGKSTEDILCELLDDTEHCPLGIAPGFGEHVLHDGGTQWRPSRWLPLAHSARIKSQPAAYCAAGNGPCPERYARPWRCGECG
jgi:hypothetical protein